MGYKVIKLGYVLLHEGVKGEFVFVGNVHGAKADLRSASPGLLFVLLGTVIIIIAVTTKFPLHEKIKKEMVPDKQEKNASEETSTESVNPKDKDHKVGSR